MRTALQRGMIRRELLALSAGAVLAPGWAAAAEKQYRIALLSPGRHPGGKVFLSELRRLGEIEGQNLVVERFAAEGHIERFAALARQAAATHPEVIITVQTMLSAVTPVTGAIPLVVRFGRPQLEPQVKSLAHPGGNMTGVSQYLGADFKGKQLQLLKAAVPSAKRVAWLLTRSNRGRAATGIPVVRQHAAQLGMSLRVVPLDDASPQAIERGFADMARQHVDVMLLSPEGALFVQAKLIARLAEEHRLPVMYPHAYYAEHGGLMAYAYDHAEIERQEADLVHKILHGAKPGDLPIYGATRFKLTINLKAAKAIGLTIPRLLLVRADKVIG